MPRFSFSGETVARRIDFLVGMVKTASSSDRDSKRRLLIINDGCRQVQCLTTLAPSNATFRPKQSVHCFGHAPLQEMRCPQAQKKYPPKACASRTYSDISKPQHFLAKGAFFFLLVLFNYPASSVLLKADCTIAMYL